MLHKHVGKDKLIKKKKKKKKRKKKWKINLAGYIISFKDVSLNISRVLISWHKMGIADSCSINRLFT